MHIFVLASCFRAIPGIIGKTRLPKRFGSMCGHKEKAGDLASRLLNPMGQNIRQEAIPMNHIDRADTAFVLISTALVLIWIIH